MNIPPTHRLNHFTIAARCFRPAVIRAADHATNRFHNVPFTLKTRPRKRNASGLLVAPGSTNCGRNARKNSATFGFRTLVRKPCMNTVRNDAAGRVALPFAGGAPEETSSEIPTYKRYADTSSLINV